MPFDGAGTYTPPGADFPVVTQTTISSTKFNNTINDMSTALSGVVTRDGQSPWTANLPAGGFKLTGLAAGSLATDSTRVADLQKGTYTYGGTAGGTADALTFNLSPAITSYVAGQKFQFIAGATNTGPATLAINGIATPQAIQIAGAALVASDILIGKLYEVFYDGTAFQITRLASQSLSTKLTTKGDMIAASAADTPVRVGVGATGSTLVADPTAAAGVSWSGGGFTTGDVKLTLKTVADAGWVLMNDTTIGNAASGGTGRANADTEALFTLLWNNTVDAQCAVSSGRGASAAADFAANKTIALPKALGRALATYGSGSGLSARALALITGTETHPLTTAELATHTHTITDSAGGHTHSGDTSAGTGTSSTVLAQTARGDNGTAGAPTHTYGGTAGAHNHTVNNAGSGTAHPNMQPTLFLNTMIKL